MSLESMKMASEEWERIVRQWETTKKEMEKAKKARARKTRLAQESAGPPRRRDAPR